MERVETHVIQVSWCKCVSRISHRPTSDCRPCRFSPFGSLQEATPSYSLVTIPDRCPTQAGRPGCRRAPGWPSPRSANHHSWYFFQARVGPLEQLAVLPTFVDLPNGVGSDRRIRAIRRGGGSRCHVGNHAGRGLTQKNGLHISFCFSCVFQAG